MIEQYSFGCVVISGREFRSDLILYPDGTIQESWRRQQGHRLVVTDILPLIQAEPETIIIGSGATGFMKTDDEFKDKLAEKGIEIIAALTADAVKFYNAIYSRKKTGACLHLAC